MHEGILRQVEGCVSMLQLCSNQTSQTAASLASHRFDNHVSDVVFFFCDFAAAGISLRRVKSYDGARYIYRVVKTERAPEGLYGTHNELRFHWIILTSMCTCVSTSYTTSMHMCTYLISRTCVYDNASESKRLQYNWWCIGKVADADELIVVTRVVHAWCGMRE